MHTRPCRTASSPRAVGRSRTLKNPVELQWDVPLKNTPTAASYIRELQSPRLDNHHAKLKKKKLAPGTAEAEAESKKQSAAQFPTPEEWEKKQRSVYETNWTGTHPVLSSVLESYSVPTNDRTQVIKNRTQVTRHPSNQTPSAGQEYDTKIKS
jgi:hypothetical protein